jgi:hypothetical protein
LSPRRRNRFKKQILTSIAGCGRTGLAAPGSAQEDIFVAKAASVTPNAPLPLSITDEIDGDVVIIAARNYEVAADAVETGTGGSVELARREVQDHVALSNTGAQVQIMPETDSNGRGPDTAEIVPGCMCVCLLVLP